VKKAESKCDLKGNDNMKIQILDQKLKALFKTERKITYETLLIIQTLDLTKSYRELGYSSLYEYLTKEIGYSEGAAQRRISSARLMKEVPSLEQELQTGELNLSQVSLAQVAFKQEEKKSSQKLDSKKKELILNRLRSKSSFETKKILLEECPSFEIPKPRANPARDEKVQVTLEFTEAEWQQVQDLMAQISHQVPEQKLEKALLYWARSLKKKSPPLRRLIEARSREKYESRSQGPYELRSQGTYEPRSQEPSESHSRGQSEPQSQRRYESRSQEEGEPRLQGQCEFVSKEGKRCQSKHFLEMDHIKPKALGGRNNPMNLRLLCRSHNQLSAKLHGLSR